MNEKEEKEQEELESETEIVQVTHKYSAFDLLEPESADEEQAESESSSEATPISSVSSKKKKEKKKKVMQSESDGNEELINFPSDFEDEAFDDYNLEDCFEIDINYLDPEKELREKMSSKKASAQRKSGGKQQHRMTLAGPPSKALGSHGLHELGFKFILSETASQMMECTEEYEVVRGQLVHFVQTGDVESIMQLLRENPCHLDTMLVTSDILKHHSTTDASMLVNKAIYLISKALNLLNLPSVPYEENERNRCVHLALFRRIQFLLKQGCWKTALQVSKALYALDMRDPLQVGLILQFLSLQAPDDDIFRYYVQQQNCSPGWRLTKLFKEYSDSEMEAFLNDFPEAHPVLLNVFTSVKMEDVAARMYFKNYFSLWSLYSGPVWKNHPQKDALLKLLRKHTPQAVGEEPKLGDSLLPLYRHQALVASDHPTVRLGFPKELLEMPILLINPFPPMDEWSERSLLDRARDAMRSLLSS